MNWKKECASSLRSLEELEDKIQLSGDEREYFLVKHDSFRCAVPSSYLSLIGDSRNDPIRLQAIPRIDELTVQSYECTDPLGEEPYKVTGRLIHRYRDRALFLVTDTCAMYCRHCFRRNFTGRHEGPAQDKEVEAAVNYVSSHPEITEVIFSGGDPLMLDTMVLEEYLARFKAVRSSLVVRVGTRMPVVMPSRIDAALVSMLSEYKPLFIMTQFNHPRECTAESMKVVSALIDAGIPILNQAVLLKNINDNADTLETLFHCLVRNRIKPYYLFQGDLAPGTSNLRASLGKGLRIMKELRGRVSGLALPVYAVDLPCGGGKVPLTEQYITGKTEKGWELTDTGGHTFLYPET